MISQEESVIKITVVQGLGTKFGYLSDEHRDVVEAHRGAVEKCPHVDFDCLPVSQEVRRVEERTAGERPTEQPGPHDELQLGGSLGVDQLPRLPGR